MDLYGGGPGSGCRGPNCGRPESSNHELSELAKKNVASFDVNRILKQAEDKAKIDDEARKQLANHLPAVVKKANKWRQYDPKKVGGYFRQGTVVANIYEMLNRKQGEWVKLDSFENRFVRTGAPVIRNRLKEIRYTGKRAGLWNLDIDDRNNRVRMTMVNKVGQPQAAPVKQETPEESKQPQRQVAAIEDTLRQGRIASTRHLGGGANDSRLVTFAEDGSKAVLKTGANMDYGRRGIEPGKGPQREAAAYEVAKLVGMTDMVPVTVIRQMDREPASVQEFRPGKEAADKSRDVRFDGNKDAARAAAFDYVIGNEDRHVGNWMMNNAGKISLIDHGLSFPERSNGMDFNQIMIGYAQKKGFSPQEQAAPYTANKDAITSALRAVGLREASIKGVSDRIDSLATGTSYASIAPNPAAKATFMNEGYRPDDWRRGMMERTRRR